MNGKNDSERAMDFSVVTLLLRLTLGVLFFFAGLGKFLGGYGNFIGFITKEMNSTWLPSVLLWPYAHALPFVEVTVGLLLLLGLFTRPVLFVTGLLLVSLTFGMILKSQSATVAANANYVFMAAVAYFASKYNCFSLDEMLRKKN